MRKIVRKSKGGTTNIKSYQAGGPNFPLKKIPIIGAVTDDWRGNNPLLESMKYKEGIKHAYNRADPNFFYNKRNTDENSLTPREMDILRTKKNSYRKGGSFFGKNKKDQNKKHKITSPGNRPGGKQYRRKAGK